MKHRISILSSKKIDHEKWDACVETHSNGLIYSTSVYLTSMAEHWHGIVIDDYAAVMALPWKRKFRIRYGYTPPFIQQLGIVGEAGMEELAFVLKRFYKFYPLADVSFNFQNTYIQQMLPVISRNNFVIDLSAGYDAIRSHYKNNLRENIRRAEKEGLQYADTSVQDGIALYHAQYGKRLKQVKEKDYRNFSILCESLQEQDRCFARAAVNHENEILAAAVFLKDNRRVYNIMNTTTTKGRDLEANHLLLDQVLQEFSGQPLLFDFEGSELPGVREFYEGFGPANQHYFHYHYNGYSWPVKRKKK